ncbi:MAG: anti-sigma factor [Chitinophagaceae bacterium]|nr:anti-sigma factor [Chitinophagaceae bacterium]
MYLLRARATGATCLLRLPLLPNLYPIPVGAAAFRLAQRMRIVAASQTAALRRKHAPNSISMSEAPKAAPAKPDLPPAPKPIRWFRTALAVAVLLLMGSILLNFYFYSQQADTSTRYEELLQQQNTLLSQKAELESSLQPFVHPDLRALTLLATNGPAIPRATVYWHPQQQDLFLVIQQLPTPPAGKQYQLWAQQNGNWMNAGLVQWTGSRQAQPMNKMAAATAFFITLEPEGGSDAPTLAGLQATGRW